MTRNKRTAKFYPVLAIFVLFSLSVPCNAYEFLSQFEDAFGKSGYTVKPVILENICASRFSDPPRYRGKMLSGKVPLDAVVRHSPDTK